MHKTTVRKETRVGMQQPDYRVTCLCGWEDKAFSAQVAEGRGKTHEANPNRRRFA